MSIRYFYMDPDANPVELTDRVWTALEWHSSAEEANAVASEWILEDPDSDLTGIYAWRRVYVLDDSAPVDHTVIGMGFIADMHIGRSEVYAHNATSRAWRLTITDLNYMLQYPLFDAADSPDRPAETDLTRIAWYLTTQEAQHFPYNTDYIDTTGGVTLDAYNLLDQSPYELIRGAMDQSGRNCFVLYDESKGGPDFDIATGGELALYYGIPEADYWASTVFLSNDIEDVSSNGAFYLGTDDEDYWPDPSRIYWKLHVLYDGGKVTVQNSAIRTQYTGRETNIDAHDLTDVTKAAQRGGRMLNESSIPNSRIAWGFHCRSGDVNSLLAGQSFQYRATHLGGLDYLGVPDFSQEGGVRIRAMDRTVQEKAPGVYYVSGSAVPIPEPDEVALDCENDLNAPFGTVTDGDGNWGYPHVGTGNPDWSNPGYVNDDDPDTAATLIAYAGGAGTPVYADLESDLGESREVVGFVVEASLMCNSDHSTVVTFYYSDNGSDWTLADATQQSFDPQIEFQVSVWLLDEPASHRYWRLRHTENEGDYRCGGAMRRWCIVGSGA